MSEQIVRGCCPLDCQDACSWLAYVDRGRVLRVAGDPEHPFTRGSLCAKVNDYPTRTYAPDRLLHPLRRNGPKGAGQFERISWDDALDIIAERFQQIIAEHGPEALMPLEFAGSVGVMQRRALRRLFHVLGATRTVGGLCSVAALKVAASGVPIGFDPEEMASSRLILLWGFNALSTAHHHWHFIEEARRRHGARIIAIDPIRTRTAQQCDVHLAIRPGSDAALAAGMARIMVAEKLVDMSMAAGAVADLDAFIAAIDAFTPERTAAVCGVAVDELMRLTREYAAARPATIRCGVGPQQTVHGEAFVRTVAALPILAGHWQLEGGGLFIVTFPAMDQAAAARADLAPPNSRQLDMARMAEHLGDPALTPPIRGLMIWGTNPAVVMPDAGRMRAALARNDLFTVVLEHFMTDTARYADIVLPSTTQLEHFDVVGSWGHHYISANLPAVRPEGEARSHGAVMRLLAQRLRLDHPALQESDEDIAASVLPPGMSLESLKARGSAKSSRPRPDLATPVRLSGPVPEPPHAPPGMLQMLTPKSHYFLNSSFANMDRHRKAMKRPTLAMHPDDATARGLHDGQEVMVRNEHGTVRAWLGVTDSVRTGVVALPGKWWGMESAANLLVPGAWSAGGQPAYNDVFVEILAAG